MELGANGVQDEVNVSGSLTIGSGAQLNLTSIPGAMTYVLGDSFDILDFGSISGTFAAVNTPALASGLSWNLGSLYTSGSISVIPESSSAILGLLSLGGLALRRRRK
jgi:hypothetical protein